MGRFEWFRSSLHLSAPKSQRFLRFLRLRCPSRTPETRDFRTRDSNDVLRFKVRWKVTSDLRFRAASSEPKTPSCCGISGDLAPSTRKSLAIAIVRFWCAKVPTVPLEQMFFCFNAVSLGRTPTGACNNPPFSEGFLEGFSRLQEGSHRRVLRRCLAVAFNGKRGSEKAS